MRAGPLLLVGLLAAARSSALQAPEEVAFRVAAEEPGVLEFDKGEQHFVVLPHAVGKFSSAAASNKTGAGSTPRSVLDVLLNRRQSCSSGYWYCEDFSQCCPTTELCCSYGYCIDPLKTCCPNGACGEGSDCCGYNHCYPVGAVCCGDESYCEAGNECYKVTGIAQDVCCTDDTCTAYVSGGITITRTSTTSYTSGTSYTPGTSSTPVTSYTTYTSVTSVTLVATPSTTAPATSTVYETYYFTITWYYYSYYWSRYGSTLSVVTSKQTSDRTVIMLSATDSEDAYAAFSSVSSTLELPTPEAATTLKSLVGSTSTQPVQTLPRGDDPSTAPSTQSTTTKSDTSTKSTSSTTATHPLTETVTATTTRGTASTTGASNTSFAPRKSLSDVSLLSVWAVFGAVTGVLMVLL